MRQRKGEGKHMAKAAVIMGSDSDWNVMQNAVKTLKSFEIEVEARTVPRKRRRILRRRRMKTALALSLQRRGKRRTWPAFWPGIPFCR